ncbi:MAG: diaminopimelate epimerase [Acidimicrobiales bacterium]
MVMRLSKHQGLGNDFLVMLVDGLPLDATRRAVDLCHRRRGVGADGLIYGVTRSDGSMAMRLLNSDGSPAGTSGNGLRCLAQAVARRRGVPSLDLDVDTPAGIRHCAVRATARPDTVMATVDMGVVCPGPDPDVDDLVDVVGEAIRPVKRWETGDIGNPHIVFEVADPFDIVLGDAGPAVEVHFPEGVNVHFVQRSGLDELTLRVWERGAGITEACGSGAAVAADVFHRWGEVGRRVVVRMPGGEAVVPHGPPTTLTGPATHIADLEVPDA